MFEVHCDELTRALSKRADALRSRLLMKMCEDHQKQNKQLVKPFMHLNYTFLYDIKQQIKPINLLKEIS